MFSYFFLRLLLISTIIINFFSEFFKVLENIIEIHAPLEKLLRKQRKLHAKPRITKVAMQQDGAPPRCSNRALSSI